MTGRDFKPGKDYDWVKNPKKLNPITGFPEGHLVTPWARRAVGVKSFSDDQGVVAKLKARRWR